MRNSAAANQINSAEIFLEKETLVSPVCFLVVNKALWVLLGGNNLHFFPFLSKRDTVSSCVETELHSDGH